MAYNIYGDFQCDKTGGVPTFLCVDWSTHQYWLEPNESLYSDEDMLEQHRKEWFTLGNEKRPFVDYEHLLNQIKNKLNEEAYENCAYQIAADLDIEL